MEYRNAVYINAENTRVNCEINSPVHGWIPYTLDPSDTDMTVDNDALLASMVLNNDVVAYVAPTSSELDTEAAAQVRYERDSLLETQVDPLVSNPLRWGSLSESEQTEWTNYRTGLLDVPAQVGFPHEVIWPTKP